MQKTQEGQNGHDRVGTTLATNKHEQACSVLLESTICLELLIKASFVEGMSEFLEGEVSLMNQNIFSAYQRYLAFQKFCHAFNK